MVGYTIGSRFVSSFSLPNDPIYVPCREKITILNPDAKPKNRVLVSRNFEYMKNLLIPIANSHVRWDIEDKRRRNEWIERRREEKRKRRRKVDRERVSNRDSCCIVQ